MKRKIRITFGISILLVILSYGLVSYYQSTNTTGIGYPPVITNSNFSFSPKVYSITSSDYIDDNKRLYFEEGDGIFNNEAYGDFIPNGRIDLIRSDTLNLNCSGETVSYYFDGEFTNELWGKGFTISSDNNYFCPNSGLFSLKLDPADSNTFFEEFSFSNSSPLIESNFIVQDSNFNNNVELDSRILFDNSKLSIGGIINSNSVVPREFLGGTESQMYSSNILSVNYSTTNRIGALGNIYSGIKRNIVSMTRGLNWQLSIPGSNLSSISNNYYIDFEGQTDSATNDYNQGKILTLNNPGGGIGISGEKNLVLKGGNIYINDNIYNEDKESILTIVALRDEGDNKNGGNVYINPNVTNIDAVIIAEGSILSYNGNEVLNSVDNPLALIKQLFIYGSVVSRNTIGENISVFNTDDYINDGSSSSNNKYNLANLRSFQIVSSNQIETGTCIQKDRITAMGISETESVAYAFAGGKECYFDEIVTGPLRPTHRVSSTVIEYNPNIQINTPSILKIN